MSYGISKPGSPTMKMNMKREKLQNRTAALLLSFGLVLSQLPPALAQTVGDGADLLAQAPPIDIKATKEPDTLLKGNVTSQVELISKDILHDEVALERYNLNFRVNAAKQGRWKGWRFFVGQEGQLICTGTALIVYVSDSFDHIHPEQQAGQSKNIRANGGVITAVPGNGLAMGADMLELGINLGHSAAARRHGYGFTQARETATKLVSGIDKKLIERENLIKQEPADDKEVAEMQELEGKVLSDFRDMATAEFERYYASASKTLAQQNSFYILDATVNKTVGLISAVFGCEDILGYAYKGEAHQARPGFDIVTGVTGLVAGTFTIANPILSRIYAKEVEKHAKKSMEQHGLPTVWENGDKLVADWGRLSNFCKNHQVGDRPQLSAMVQRMDVYNANEKFCVDELQRNARALRRGNRTAVQNMGMATLVGSSKIAQATLQTVAGANYFHDNTRRFTLFSTGGLVYLPSVWLAVLDNVRIQGTNEMRRARLKKEGTLPGQIIKRRMDELSVVEKKI
jgi:hypothetical protein